MLKLTSVILLLLSLVFILSTCTVITDIADIKTKNGPVTKINLSHQHLTEIPPEIFKIKSLKVLVLHDNDITEIPTEIGELVNLEKLVLSRNKIEVVPDEIGKLTKLENLSLKANKIKELPPSIGNLKKLELFRMGFNKLTFLPDEICDLERLTHLYLDYNDLVSLPDSIGKLPLVELYVNWNQLTTVPNTFYDLRSLVTVNFAYAGPMFKLNEDICKMWRLETLFIDRASLNFQPRCLEIRSRSNPRFTIFLES